MAGQQATANHKLCDCAIAQRSHLSSNSSRYSCLLLCSCYSKSMTLVQLRLEHFEALLGLGFCKHKVQHGESHPDMPTDSIQQSEASDWRKQCKETLEQCTRLLDSASASPVAVSFPQSFLSCTVCIYSF